MSSSGGPPNGPPPTTATSPQFTDLVASVEDALAAFARQPDRVKALFGRYLKHMADPTAPTRRRSGRLTQNVF